MFTPFRVFHPLWQTFLASGAYVENRSKSRAYIRLTPQSDPIYIRMFDPSKLNGCVRYLRDTNPTMNLLTEQYCNENGVKPKMMLETILWECARTFAKNQDWQINLRTANGQGQEALLAQYAIYMNGQDLIANWYTRHSRKPPNTLVKRERAGSSLAEAFAHYVLDWSMNRHLI